ncbi:MAG: hypothetical protein IJV40_15830 [Oscillospiraceae bacterium]|nr:hypothetical protein [Oscillospiraceae bacterium]
MKTLNIDPEFAAVAPPLKECELRILEEDILEHGCITPLITWGDVIIDGHNRYRICREHNIPFGCEEMEFPSREEAKVWILTNQLGRRNLSSFQRCEMVLRFEPDLKAAAEKRRKEAISFYRKTGDRMEYGKKTRDVLADMAGVSHGTIAKAKVIMEIGDEETIRRLRMGEISINHALNTLTHAPHVEKEKTENICFSDVEIPQASKSGLDDIQYVVDALLEELYAGDLDRDFLISMLTDVQKLVMKEIQNGKETV